ncbi:MAG TPA: glycosyltransferase family 4 protein [Burkholderiales bacterium]|nr:glycosyltransferase family 4 protein [Burkholderiales bacterium]
MRIARIATVPFFLYNHLRGQIEATINAGHEVTLISGSGQEVEWLKTISGVRFHEIDIPRRISPLRDLRAVFQLYLFFRREKFDIVHSTTPKAGMLCAIAAFLAKIPVRLHTFTGQAWMELEGMTRMIAKTGDKVTVALNTLCYADSPSQLDFMFSEGISPKGKTRMLGSGSLAGVDLSRFDPEKFKNSKQDIRKELDIPEDHRVITFIGRITKDKGIEELLAAFKKIRQCTLLLIGPGETKSGAFSENSRAIDDPDIRMTGYSPVPERYLAVTDIFCLPSYREGFGNVVIEAAAMGIPSIGTDIVGLRDAVIDGKTGLLVKPKEIDALADALEVLLKDEAMRAEMGKAARERAVMEFSSDKVNAAVLAEYDRLLSGATR